VTLRLPLITDTDSPEFCGVRTNTVSLITNYILLHSMDRNPFVFSKMNSKTNSSFAFEFEYRTYLEVFDLIEFDVMKTI